MGKKVVDITGQKFGRLTVLDKLHNYHKKDTYWLCVCECGNLKEVTSSHLTTGKTKSCGCLRKENSGNRLRIHGKCNTRLHSIWQNMKNRCYHKKSNRYKYYGARGIAVCSEWKDDFMNFYDWSMANGYADNLTIDRIDVNGNYEPNNCRWVDYKTQSRNRRSVKRVTINNETHCLSEWCEILDIKYNTVQTRIYNRGWSIEKALELEGNHER